MGNGVKRFVPGGWNTPLTAGELRDPQAIERRYREAVELFRDFVGSEANRLRFFALARDAVTNPQVRNPPAWFTGVLKKGSSPTNAADDWARVAMQELDRREIKIEDPMPSVPEIRERFENFDTDKAKQAAIEKLAQSYAGKIGNT